MLGSGRVCFFALLAAVVAVGCGSAVQGDAPQMGGAGDAGESSGEAGASNAGRANNGGKGGSVGGHAGSTAGSAGATHSGGAASNVPVDNRPPRPTWDPPFSVGTPGWRDSTTPLCEAHQGRQDAFDVWADERGVFGIFSAVCNVLAGDACGKQGLSLQFNDGSGWQLLYALPPGSGMGSTGSLHLTGFDGGPLLISGFLDAKTGLWRIGLDGSADLQAELEVGRPFVVGSDVAYALGADSLYRFKDDKWSTFAALPEPVQEVWADQDTIIVVGQNQAVYRKSTGDDAFVHLEDVPAGDYSAVWGFSADDIWLGSQAKQLVHYDGATWKVVETGSEDVSGAGIAQLWGSNDGDLFFRTRIEMGRLKGDEAELLITLPPNVDPSMSRVITSGMWGLSSKEVFLAVADKDFRKYACGEQFMLWFDGETFHSF